VKPLVPGAEPPTSRRLTQYSPKFRLPGELALLAVIILAMSEAIFILRQKQEKEEKSKETD
jgi:hypothetical protein